MPKGRGISRRFDETHFANTIEQAGKVARRINHPHVKIAPHTFHMALEEADMLTAVRDHLDLIGLLTLSDHNQRLPGVGLVGFESLATALIVGGYHGWVSIDANTPATIDTLQASIEMLRVAGFNGVA